MHQVIQEHPVRLSPFRVPDLSRYAVFIQLGRVHVPGQLELALQALNKTLRCSDGEIRLLVATQDGHAWPRSLSPHCSFHTPGDLRQALEQRGARILAPAFSDPHGTLILHALASGVPLGALNLASQPSLPRAALAHDGSALLAITYGNARPH